MVRIAEERCSCGGLMVYGHMYGTNFIAGDVWLDLVFRGRESLLKGFFSNGQIPVRGEEALICSKCFKQGSV